MDNYSFYEPFTIRDNRLGMLGMDGPVPCMRSVSATDIKEIIITGHSINIEGATTLDWAKTVAPTCID